MLELPTDKRTQLKYFSALFRLNGMAGEFKDIVAVLKHTQKELQSANNSEKDETEVRWRQGALQLLEDLFNHIDNSRELVEKLEGKA